MWAIKSKSSILSFCAVSSKKWLMAGTLLKAQCYTLVLLKIVG